MGGKKKEKTVVQAAPPEPAAPSFDPNAFLGPMMEAIGQQQQMTHAILAQNAASQAQMMASAPQSTVIDTVDYEAENKKLRQKLDQEVVEAKRKGVLGTILTSLDNEDAPNTVKSLLTGTSK